MVLLGSLSVVLSKSEGSGAGAAQGLESVIVRVVVGVGVKGLDKKTSGFKRVTVVVGVSAGVLGDALRCRLGLIGVKGVASGLSRSL